MQNKAMLAALFMASGCGAARVETEHPDLGRTETTETREATPIAEDTAETTRDAPVEAVAPPRVSPIQTGSLVVNCDWEFPRADLPDEPVRFTTGPLQVRAQSLVLDRDPASATVAYCRSREPVPEGARLVFYMDDYDQGAASWDGRRVASPYARAGEAMSEDEASWPTVTLPGQTVTAVRQMAYCPTNPRRPCFAAGDYTQLIALPHGDPSGPRSGWDFTERALRPTPARAATSVTGIDACGLTVSYRRIADCTASTSEELQACLDALHLSCVYDGEEVARACSAAQVVVSDGNSEVAVPAKDAWQIACVDHVAVIYDSPVDAMSRRSFVAIAQAEGRITDARRMTIVDHEEARSECMNAWDGVTLAPIVGQSRLLGAVVHGAGGSPRFDVSRGDVGDATFAPVSSEDEADEDLYAPTPHAFRVTSAGLAPLEVNTTPTAPPCPLHVIDPDGQTKPSAPALRPAAHRSARFQQAR